MVGAEYYLVWPALGRPNSLPNGARRNPQGFVLFLLYFSLNLVSYQHQVGPGVDGVRDEVLVLPLQLQSVLIDILGVLLGDLLCVISGIFHLLKRDQSISHSIYVYGFTSFICLTLLNLIKRTIG